MRWGSASSPASLAIKARGNDLKLRQGRLRRLRKISSPEHGEVSIGCPGSWWSHHPWRYSRKGLMYLLGTWFTGHGDDGLAIGLDLSSFFQP